MKVMEVKKERSGWRDEGISRRHRLWGVSCSATDIDFLLVEYIYNTPKAIIEYKNAHAPPQKLSASQYQVLKKLGDRAQIPVFAVRYADDFSKFYVVPVNKKSSKLLRKRTTMTENEFVTFLYKIRNINFVPAEILGKVGVA